MTRTTKIPLADLPAKYASNVCCLHARDTVATRLAEAGFVGHGRHGCFSTVNNRSPGPYAPGRSCSA